jgi:hypothetical protein
MSRPAPKPGRYKHFKGTIYTVVGIAEHTEGDYKLVVYHTEEQPERMYARSLEMFCDEVIVAGGHVPRFVRL